MGRPPSRPVDTPGHGLAAPRLSIGTYLISHDGRHVLQDRKATVSAPPTCSSTDGSISADPGEPQTLRVYRISVQRNRVVAKQRSRRCPAAGSMGRCSWQVEQ